MNTSWDRWIFASISQHFSDNVSGLTVYIEGEPRHTTDLSNFFEVRMDGPHLTELSKDYWRLYVEINCLVQSRKDDSNIHTIHTNLGKVATAFTNIEVFKYGDDDSHLGCLKLIDNINVRHFGIIGPSDDLLQATVEGHYEMFLKV